VEPDLLVLLGKAFSELVLHRSDYLLMLGSWNHICVFLEVLWEGQQCLGYLLRPRGNYD
jgi:hypothetical protein